MYKLTIVSFVAIVLLGSVCVHAQRCNPYATVSKADECGVGLKCSKATRTCEKAKEGEYCIPDEVSEELPDEDVPDEELRDEELPDKELSDEDEDENNSNDKIKKAWRAYCGADLTCDLDLVPEGERQYGQKALGKCKSTRPIKAVS